MEERVAHKLSCVRANLLLLLQEPSASYRYRIEGYNHRFESYVPYEIPEYKDVTDADPVIIIGAGPAGMFAALKLLTLGFKPIILERGKNVRDRIAAQFILQGYLDARAFRNAQPSGT